MISTLGPSMKTVFRSRWRALWWCAGVLLTAYCSVPDTKDDASTAVQVDRPAAAHANPWSKDPAPK